MLVTIRHSHTHYYCYQKVLEEAIYLRKRTSKDVSILLTSDGIGSHCIRDV